MINSETRNGVNSPADPSRTSPPVLSFLVTIFLAGFLVFQVQPIVTKQLAPRLGGSAAIWISAMVFFQVALLVGYGIAYAIDRLRSPAAQCSVYALFALAAVLLCSPHLNLGLLDARSEEPSFAIIALLALQIGAPYIVLTAASPLLQNWFRGVFPDREATRLYAVSNTASLAALLSYPVLVEPTITIPAQAALWQWSFFAFCVALAGTIFITVRSGRPTTGSPDAAREGLAISTPSLGAVFAYEAFCSMLLIGTTNYLCRDVASMPFLWLAPLTIYLTTFILSFGNRLAKEHSFLFTLFLVFGSAYLSNAFGVLFLTRLVNTLFLLFTGGMVCHREIVRRAPSNAALSTFYLAIAAGGAFGSVFAGLAAPMLFDSYWETTIAVWGIAGLAALDSIAGGSHLLKPVLQTRMRCFGAALALVLYLAGLNFAHSRDESTLLYRTRNFYGVSRVFEGRHPIFGTLRWYINGGIIHGEELLDPEGRDVPVSYYGPESGIGVVLRSVFPERKRRIGIVGLGTGKMLSLTRPDDVVRFFEINPAVVDIARRYFTSLNSAGNRADVVLGDGRLMLARDTSGPFDVIVLDAFSSDAIPLHLLTKEAFALYLGHLAPDGYVVFHITNTHLDLAPPLARIAAEFGLQAFQIEHQSLPPSVERTSFYVIIPRAHSDVSAFQSIAPLASATEVPSSGPLWTDDYANLFSTIRWKGTFANP